MEKNKKMIFKSIIFRIGAMLVVVMLIGGLGYLAYQLDCEKKVLEGQLDHTEKKTVLLNRKYKEEKALVGRLQRENLALNGQVRQAKIDAEAAIAEADKLRSRMGKSGRQLEVCVEEKKGLSRQVEKWKTDYTQLSKQQEQTAAQLKNTRQEKDTLKSRVETLASELGFSESKNKRYYAHNRKLAKIARALVARIEKEELGSSVLVNEPIFQFDRVELEGILQEYLDRIDKEMVVQ